MRTAERKRKDKIILDLCRLISIMILIAYCFWNEAMTSNVGQVPGFLASYFMLIRRRWINNALDSND